jgi:hypothetical protein
VDQLYTPAPQQQYSSPASLGGVPRVTQTSGPGYRYYENVQQSVSNWIPQTPSQLEPMDPYVRSLFPMVTSHSANPLPLVKFSHTQDRFSAGTSSSDTQPNRYH